MIFCAFFVTIKIAKSPNYPLKTGLKIQKGRKKSSYLYCNCLIIRGAVNEARTRDPQLGKLVLYQLSYYRIVMFLCKKPSETVMQR